MRIRLALAGAVLLGAVLRLYPVWFALPYLSYPRAGNLDRDVVAFLQANVGHQRVVNTMGKRPIGLAPNYGSAFRIPVLNYESLPTPTIAPVMVWVVETGTPR